MGRRLIEVMQVLADQVHKGGYQHRVLEDSIYQESQRRKAAEKDRDHWKQARQEAHEAGELMKAEIETLRKELSDAQRELSEQGQAHSVETQQETADLRQQLADAQRAVSDAFAEVNSVREQLDAASVTILAQKRGIQYLRLLIDKVRGIVGRDDAMSERLKQISQALDEFDHGTIEPTPSPEVERLQAFVNEVREARDNYRWPDSWDAILTALAELDAGTEPTPVAEQAEGGA